MLKPMAVANDHWFFGPVLSCRSVYVQVIFGSVLINVFALASSLYIMTIYDRVVPNNAIHSMWWRRNYSISIVARTQCEAGWRFLPTP